MKNKTSVLKSASALLVIAALFSFSNRIENETPVAPFKVMLIKHSVADYAKWKPAFDAHSPIRKENGQTDLDLLRGIDNPNLVLVVEKITDVQKAKDFTQLPDLKETMEKAGVNSAPEFSFFDVIRNDDGKIATKDRCIVTHKVKDFDAWLKVYDGEGKPKRASEGMVDRVLARGIDDPNVVHIVFAVTDIAKAKAAVTSDAKKKLMLSAGVEGIPTIEFYKQAQ